MTSFITSTAEQQLTYGSS